MKGRWAAGIVPRNFTWIVQDRLAVSERPGGYAPHHRPVRRQEEILWLSAQGFTRVVSLLPSTHNLRAYEDLNLPSSHFPLPAHDDVREVLAELYPALLRWIRKGERLLIHQEELGERVSGVIAGFMYWSGMMAEPPQAISVIEQLLRRQLGAAGRLIVAQSVELSLPLDEYGVPLPRRTIAIADATVAQPSAGAPVAPPEAKTTPKRTSAPRSGAKVAAIRSINSSATASAGKAKAPAAPQKKAKAATKPAPTTEGSDTAPKARH